MLTSFAKSDAGAADCVPEWIRRRHPFKPGPAAQPLGGSVGRAQPPSMRHERADWSEM